MNLTQQQEVVLYKLLQNVYKSEVDSNHVRYSTLKLIFYKVVIMSFSQMGKFRYKTCIRLRSKLLIQLGSSTPCLSNTLHHKNSPISKKVLSGVI